MRTLTESELSSFEKNGYLIVPDVFHPNDLEPLRAELHEVIQKKAEQLYAEGIISDKHENEPFERQLACIELDSIEAAKSIREVIVGRAGGGYTSTEMFKVLSHPKLMHTLEGLIGTEIVASSVYRCRSKSPYTKDGNVPWHQDSAYLQEHCDEARIITCWVPLVDSNVHNGCMQILSGAHKSGLAKHYSGGNAGFLVIEDEDLPTGEPIAAECPRGGVVFMTNLTPHGSTQNSSDIIRWSIDLRYQAIDTPHNLDLLPPESFGEDIESAVKPYTMACYPPEADFLVHSKRQPELVADYDQYIQRRNSFDANTKIPYPLRQWTRIGE